MKSPGSTMQDSLHYHTCALIDSTTTNIFASREFRRRNNLLGKCTRGTQIVVQIANERMISTSKIFSPANVSIGQKLFNGLNFAVLPHLKCVDFIFGLPRMKESNIPIHPSTGLVLIGDIPFPCESQPRRVSCLLIDSSKTKKILTKVARNKHT